MSTLKTSALAAGILAAMASFATPALAQSTDGFHTHLVFPVVTDSNSFTQRFTFTNPDGNRNMVIVPHFVPGEGAKQTTEMDCPQITLLPSQQKEYATLREMCPGMTDGSNYGFLTVTKVTASNRIFTAFSRIYNPHGNGFSVEAFPLHTFTSADSVVTGLRRRAAANGNPTFQTNCFIGNLNEVTPAGSPVTTTVEYTLTTGDGAPLGAGVVNVAPGKLVRMLDIFTAAGAPAGDHEDATITFREMSVGEPGLLTFCTVQDNTSFGADFRIGKQELGKSTPYSGIGSQDDTVSRNSVVSAEVAQSGGARSFAIPAGQFTNTHVVYFRHPDWVQCELLGVDGLRPAASYGLEMRLVNQYGTGVIAGGAGSTGFGKLYLGDKADRNNGANTRYAIQVESNGSNEGVNRPYKLHCQSGSGHTLGDLVRYQQPGNQF